NSRAAGQDQAPLPNEVAWSARAWTPLSGRQAEADPMAPDVRQFGTDRQGLGGTGARGWGGRQDRRRDPERPLAILHRNHSSTVIRGSNKIILLKARTEMPAGTHTLSLPTPILRVHEDSAREICLLWSA